MIKLTIKPLVLNLKYVWKISRNSSAEKTNFIICAEHNQLKGFGEVAPNIRYNETPEAVLFAFENFCKTIEDTASPEDIIELLANINMPSALKFGIEQALINLICRIKNLSLSTYLNITKPQYVQSCYTLPIMDANNIIPFVEKYNLKRFTNLKLKVSTTNNFDELKQLAKIYKKPIFIDGNETWENPDDVIKFIEKVNKYSIAFIEQPMPANMIDEYIYLKKNSTLPLMADESCLAKNDFNIISKQFNGVNMKLMKAGGILNGIKILNQAKQYGLITMVGCMIETTLGMHVAWLLSSLANYADLDGYMIIENEPYGMLSEENGKIYANNNL